MLYANICIGISNTVDPEGHVSSRLLYFGITQN